MPIYIGQSTKNQQQITLNGKNMQRVYVGDKLVWSKITKLFNGGGFVLVHTTADLGSYVMQTTFKIGNDVYMIANGGSTGIWYGFKWNGSIMVSDNSIISGMIGNGSYACPTAFYIGNDLYLVVGLSSGMFYGYKWNGSSWVNYPAIISGLADSGTYSRPTCFWMGGNLYCLNAVTEYNSTFGYKWNGSSWLSDNSKSITGPGSRPMTDVFTNNIDTYLFYTTTDTATDGRLKWNGSGWTDNHASDFWTGLPSLIFWVRISSFIKDSQIHIVLGRSSGVIEIYKSY